MSLGIVMYTLKKKGQAMPTIFATNLTEEEKSLVSELERIASVWPEHLAILVNPESVRGFYVLRLDDDGFPAYSDWGGQTIDSKTIVARVSIPCTIARISK